MEQAFGTLWIGLLVLGAFVSVLAWFTRPRGEKRLCPKRVGSLSRALMPWAWVWPLRCGFDLSGLKQRAVCPECGQASIERRRLRGRVGSRPILFGLLLIAGGGMLPAGRRVDQRLYAPLVPTLALVAIDEHNSRDYRNQEKPFEAELDKRVSKGRVLGQAARLLSDQLVVDLRSDAEQYNAERAILLLDTMWPDSRGALESTLASTNWQAMSLAAALLRKNQPASPTPALLAACIDELRNDRGEPGWYFRMSNAMDSTEYLIKHSALASEMLSAALDDWEAQTRLLAAIAITESGLTEHFDRAAAVMLEHLGDNDVQQDAPLAAWGLFTLGEAALPALDSASADPDDQRRLWAQAIAANIRGTPWTELEHGLESVRITMRSRDPIREGRETLMQRFTR